MEFKDRLTQVRKLRGMNQETLAEQIGVSRQAVSKWETGDAMPDSAKLMALADVLEVSMDYLCGREGAQNVELNLEVPAPAPKKVSPVRIAIIALLAAVLLGGGFGAGWLLSEKSTDTGEIYEITMPETVTASGFRFFTSPTRCEFIPSVANEGMTYQVSFSRSDGKELIFDAPLAGAFCYAETPLIAGYSYAVTAIISNGLETRLIPLATNLTFGSSSASWQPIE